jgi:hypothetical protein
MKCYIVISLLLLAVYSCGSTNSTQNIPINDLKVVYSNYDTIITSNKQYSLSVYANIDTLKAKGKIVLQIKTGTKWIVCNELEYDNIYYYTLYNLKNDFIIIKFEDVNNDGVKDIFFFSGWGVRQANEFYRLYLVDQENDSLIAVKSTYRDNDDFFINPYYEKTDSTLMTSSLYGDTIAITKYRFNKNSIFSIK